MDFMNTGVLRGMDRALEISAMDGTNAAQVQHLFTLTMIHSNGDKNVASAIANLRDVYKDNADPENKMTDTQKLKLEQAAERRLTRAEGISDRITTV